MAKKHSWVIHATHPTTYQTHIIRREQCGGEWLVQDVLVEMGYLGVMMSAADYYDGPNFHDPWAKMRASRKERIPLGPPVVQPPATPRNRA